MHPSYVYPTYAYVYIHSEEDVLWEERTPLFGKMGFLLTCVYFASLLFLLVDSVAVPDYPSGATEHWGIITYRESRLLYDPLAAGANDEQNTADIVAHEVSHHVSYLLQVFNYKTINIVPFSIKRTPIYALTVHFCS